MKKNASISLLLVLSYLIMIIIVLYVNYNFKLPDTFIIDNKIMEFNEGWTYLNCNEILTNSVSKKLKDEEPIIMTNKVPNVFMEDTVLCMETNHQTLKVYINNKLIYSSDIGKNKVYFGKLYGNVWNIVRIPEEFQGQDITLIINSPYKYSRRWVYPVTLGTETATILYLIKNNIGTFISSFLILLMGIIFIGFTIIVKLKHIDFSYNGIFYLGIFSLMSFIWIITDSNILQFITKNKAPIYLLSFCTFILLPIPFLQYVKEICIHKPKVFNVLSLLFIIAFFNNLTLYIFNIAELFHTIIIVHLLIILSIIITFYNCYIENKDYKNKNARDLFYSLQFFGIFICLNLMKFYKGNNTNNSDLFRCGLFSFIVFLSISSLKKSLFIINEHRILQEKLNISNLILIMQNEQYEKLKINIEETSKMRHNMRQHFLVIKNFIEVEQYKNVQKYLNELSNSIEPEYDFICQNPAINAIVKHYIDIAKKNSINTTVSIDLSEEIHIVETDICIIIGNILENAVEACIVQTLNNKFINIKATINEKNMFVFIVKNSFDNKIYIKNNDFISTKHTGIGIGTASIKSITDKYNGIVKFEYKNKIFKVSVLINL